MTTLTEIFPCFSSLERQMAGYTSQRRGTARKLPNFSVLCIVCFVSYSILFVCIHVCVLYFCHRVATQLQSNIYIYHIISYHIISYHIYHIISYHIISYHIISYHIISYHIISYHIISYHIISYYIISYIIYIIYHIYHISYHIIYILSYISYHTSYHVICSTQNSSAGCHCSDFNKI
jgi:hypothetical protein